MSSEALDDVRVNYNFVNQSVINVFLDKDMVKMYEEAFKQQPLNEDLGAQTFFANVRAGQWKSAQLVMRSRNRPHVT
jgi:hypothetical protein